MSSLTAQQRYACEIHWNRKANGLTQTDVANQVNVSTRTLQRWSNLDEWKRYETELAKRTAQENLSEVLDVLQKKAIEGKNAKFMQLYLQVAGALTEKHENVNRNIQEEDNRTKNEINEEIQALREEIYSTPNKKETNNNG